MPPFSKREGRLEPLDFLDHSPEVYEETGIKETHKNDNQEEKSPGIFWLELGNYKTIIFPTSILLIVYFWVQISTTDIKVDSRITPQFTLDENECLIICFTYILSSFVLGPRLMKSRNPIVATKLKLVYHSTKVIISSYLFIKGGFLGWFFKYNWFCQPIDHSPSDENLVIVRMAQVFAATKLLDFCDTIFFILEKRWSQVSMLHVVHHTGMCFSIFAGSRYSPGGHLTFAGWVNCAAHSIVHLYKLFALIGPSIKPYLWWKSYLIWIQMLEYALALIHTGQLYFQTCDLKVPRVFMDIVIFYAILFILLFCDFYQRMTHTKRQMALHHKKIDHEEETQIYQAPPELPLAKEPVMLFSENVLTERSNNDYHGSLR